MDTSEDISLIAPCGMNCAICMNYLRERNKCPGCRGSDTNKPITRVRCKIKKCEFFNKDNNNYCFECEKYPCDKLEHIDNRYKTKYNMSMIENLEFIKNSGMTKFLDNERIRWTCNECGGTICVHKGLCYSCGKKR
jgi:Protein of unknown function (DUF3795)